MLLPIALAVNYLILGNLYFSQLSIFLTASIIGSIISVLNWRILLAIALLVQNRYPRQNQILRRLLISLSLYILITTATITFSFILYDQIPFFEYDINIARLKWGIIAGIFSNIITSSAIEGLAYYERWRKATAEAEELKRENLQTQLESLKAQVNPHFLFNSLNTLCSLIVEDPPKAENFLLKLSKVYRYLLISSKDDLATLSAEIKFIHSYYHLLKTRYGNSVYLSTNIDENYLSCKLPSLTLQLLVENAVKHNIMEKERPLKILISITEKGKLIVSNNLQRKLNGVSSNKIGLSNIRKKYKLLKQEDIQITEEAGNFTVELPLIKDMNTNENAPYVR